MQHLHTEYERELVPLFVKVLGIASWSKLEDDAADRSKAVTVKLGAQSDEQLHLLFVEGLAVGQIISPDPDASTVATANSFDGVRTGERHNVPPGTHKKNSCSFFPKQRF
nr:hypothetical protein [uncultured Oscillibacter sp.]